MVLLLKALPDDFISDAMETHPSWFIGGKSVDADDVIDHSKCKIIKKLTY